MTSLSMALAGLGVQLDGAPVTPASLNRYLEAHSDYQCAAGDCNNLVLNCVHNITDRLALDGEAAKPSAAKMAADTAAGTVVYIAHVHDGGHFVLVTGYDESTDSFSVHDPFYPSKVSGSRANPPPPPPPPPPPLRSLAAVSLTPSGSSTRTPTSPTSSRTAW